MTEEPKPEIQIFRHCLRSRGRKFHYARLAAVSTLAISIATVISPTPPGTGVIAACLLRRLPQGDVADEAGLAFALFRRGNAIDADVDDDRRRA